MTKLHPDWLTQGILDFEYKKFVLMAYLQQIGSEFTANRLYPYLPELKYHFDSCVQIRNNQQAIKRFFPKNVTGVDVETWNFLYQEKIQEEPYLDEINDILDFAIPGLSGMLEEGTERFAAVGENIQISPVGIVPLHTQEGYLFFCHSLKSVVSVFQYQLALYNNQKERYLKTVFVDSIRMSLGVSLTQLKVNLVKQNQALPNPATYVVESKYDYPLEETLLPVAKRLIIEQMNAA